MHLSATFVFLLLGLAVSQAASLAKLEEPLAKDAQPASDELEEKDRSKKHAIFGNHLLGSPLLSALAGLQVSSAINVPQYLPQVSGAAILADPRVVPALPNVGELLHPAIGLPAVNYHPQAAIVEEIVQPAFRPWSYPYYGLPDFINAAPVVSPVAAPVVAPVVSPVAAPVVSTVAAPVASPVAASVAAPAAALYNDALVYGGLPYGLYPDAALNSPYIGASLPYGLYPDAALNSPYIGASLPYGLYTDAVLNSPYIGASSPYGLYSDAVLNSPYIGASSPYGLYSDAVLNSPYIGASLPYGLSPYNYVY